MNIFKSPSVSWRVLQGERSRNLMAGLLEKPLKLCFLGRSSPPSSEPRYLLSELLLEVKQAHCVGYATVFLMSPRAAVFSVSFSAFSTFSSVEQEEWKQKMWKVIRVWGEKVCVSVSAESLHPSAYLKYFRGDTIVFCSLWQQIRGHPEDSGVFGLKMNLLCSQSSSNTAQDANSSLSLSTSDVHIVSILRADLAVMCDDQMCSDKTKHFSSDVRDLNWLISQFYNDGLGKNIRVHRVSAVQREKTLSSVNTHAFVKLQIILGNCVNIIYSCLYQELGKSDLNVGLILTGSSLAIHMLNEAVSLFNCLQSHICWLQITKSSSMITLDVIFLCDLQRNKITSLCRFF